MRAAGIVLCGGKSSRMGRAKAWLPWRGQPLVAWVVGVLQKVVDEIVVVASDSLELPPLPARIARDREPELGPLGGIREGLQEMDAELAYVCATDAPFLSPRFVATLLEVGRPAAPVLDGHVQTLAAVYAKSSLACAETLLAQGRLRPLYLLEASGYRTLSREELPDPDSVRGFNTPGEYLESVRADDPGARAVLEFRGRAQRIAGRRELEVPIGTLGDVLAHAPKALRVLDRERVALPFPIAQSAPSHDPSIPIGAGECVTLRDPGGAG